MLAIAKVRSVGCRSPPVGFGDKRGCDATVGRRINRVSKIWPVDGKMQRMVWVSCKSLIGRERWRRVKVEGGRFRGLGRNPWSLITRAKAWGASAQADQCIARTRAQLPQAPLVLIVACRHQCKPLPHHSGRPLLGDATETRQPHFILAEFTSRSTPGNAIMV